MLDDGEAAATPGNMIRSNRWPFPDTPRRPAIREALHWLVKEKLRL
jgi:hypothetical protein